MQKTKTLTKSARRKEAVRIAPEEAALDSCRKRRATPKLRRVSEGLLVDDSKDARKIAANVRSGCGMPPEHCLCFDECAQKILRV